MAAEMDRVAPSLRSSLQGELVDRIKDLLRNSGREGDLLREAALARGLGVSRSPVRAALRHLVVQDILSPEPTGGYVIRCIPPTERDGLDSSAGTDRLHSRILRDIILGGVPEPMSESALMRRYGVGRGELTRVLRRLVREGLAEPLPGRGWSLLAFSEERLIASYRLRIVLEPAMLDDPGYKPDRTALSRLSADHEAAMTSLDASTPWQDIFKLDAVFHETLAAGTGNDLIVDIIHRENQLRRLAEYVGYSRLERIRESMVEHIQIIDALLASDLNWARALLRKHLVVSLEETEAHFARDLEFLQENAATLFPPSSEPGNLP
jgi:DNA-binding GntR family transcriptional regulator